MAVLVATVAVMAPRPAAALFPLPPAPVRLPIADIGHTILTLAERYTQTPLTDKRRLHNEMVLLINTGPRRDLSRPAAIRGVPTGTVRV